MSGGAGREVPGAGGAAEAPDVPADSGPAGPSDVPGDSKASRAPEVGAEPPRREPSPAVRTTIVTVACLLAGVLFGTSASLARTQPSTSGAQDLVGLITARDAQVKELSQVVEQLQAEVDALGQDLEDGEARIATRSADRIAPTVGAAPVQGPAVQVTLDDAGYSLDTIPDGYTVDDVVVHQQDLQGVVNALWAGGAEAIMVQDQRIVSTSAVQCVGSTLYLQGRVYSPPSTITAVGDQQRLQAALASDPVVATYRSWADAIGLGYDVQELDQVELPSYYGGFRPTYATVSQTPPSEPDPTPSG